MAAGPKEFALCGALMTSDELQRVEDSGDTAAMDDMVHSTTKIQRLKSW